MEGQNLFEKINEMNTYLGRIDERTKMILDKDYITRSEFKSEITPIRSIIYGLVGIISLSFIGALFKLIIK